MVAGTQGEVSVHCGCPYERRGRNDVNKSRLIMQQRDEQALWPYGKVQIAAPAAADAIVAVVSVFVVVVYHLQEIENLSGQRSKNERRQHDVEIRMKG